MRVDTGEPVSEGALRELLTALRDLKYGSVEIVVHDGRIVQIERREKVRLESRRAAGV